MSEVKKAIIVAGGLGARFLPLSKTVPKQLWPLVDKPIIQYIVEELRASGISQIVFVLGPESKQILSYFEKSPKLERILKKRKKEKSLIELESLKELQKGISISFALQQKPLGDGHAILQAKEKIGKVPFVVLFGDDLVESKIPCTAQLLKVFKTCQRPIVALDRVPREQVPLFGMVETEKIAHRLFKLKRIIEKPLPSKVSSDLVVVGKYVLTPDVFDYLKKQKPDQRDEITLADALANLLRDGKIVYGYEFEGEWLSCGDKLAWLKSHLRLCLDHPQFGEELKKYLKEII